jgi:hypothetical protein
MLRAMVALALLCGSAQAGLCPSLPGPRNDFELFAGYSPYSPTLIGTDSNRRFVLAGIDYSYRCWDFNHVSVSFTMGAMPAAIALQPATISYFGITGLPPPSIEVRTPPHAVYGFGITPLGGTFELARRRRLHPFLEFGLGLIASTEPIPENVPDATGLNFLVIIGAGVRFDKISLGYKFVHISNAGTTDFNPGLDNGVIYAGYSLVR